MHDEAIKLGFSEKVGNIASSNWYRMLCKHEEVSFLQQLSVNIRYLLSLRCSISMLISFCIISGTEDKSTDIAS